MYSRHNESYINVNVVRDILLLLLILFCFFLFQRKGTRIVLWTEEQEEELQMLYEEFKDSDGTGHHNIIIVLCMRGTWSSLSVYLCPQFQSLCNSRNIILWFMWWLSLVIKLYFFLTDVLGNILKKLTAKRSRARVVDKLLSMGLVSERRELYKKRSRSAHGKSSGKSSGKGMVKLFSMYLISITITLWTKFAYNTEIRIYLKK